MGEAKPTKAPLWRGDCSSLC